MIIYTVWAFSFDNPEIEDSYLGYFETLEDAVKNLWDLDLWNMFNYTHISIEKTFPGFKSKTTDAKYYRLDFDQYTLNEVENPYGR